MTILEIVGVVFAVAIVMATFGYQTGRRIGYREGQSDAAKKGTLAPVSLARGVSCTRSEFCIWPECGCQPLIAEPLKPYIPAEPDTRTRDQLAQASPCP